MLLTGNLKLTLLASAGKPLLRNYSSKKTGKCDYRMLKKVHAHNRAPVPPVYQHPQTITLANGATIQVLSISSLRSQIELSADSTNHHSWNPEKLASRMTKTDGKASQFRSKFGAMFEDEQEQVLTPSAAKRAINRKDKEVVVPEEVETSSASKKKSVKEEKEPDSSVNLADLSEWTWADDDKEAVPKQKKVHIETVEAYRKKREASKKKK